MWDDLEDIKWLYRGVPRESHEVAEIEGSGEIRPPRPDRIGEIWRRFHVAGDTETAYTSWTSDRSIAEAAAEYSSSDLGYSGEIVVFKVRLTSIPEGFLFPGREDENEYLIQGLVEGVSISNVDSEVEDD